MKHRYNLWKDFSTRDNNHVVEWNSRAKEEREIKVRSLKIIKHQDTLWGGSLSGKEFVGKYARKRHALQATTITIIVSIMRLEVKNLNAVILKVLILIIFTVCIIHN
jgi:hypothetical protein